MDVLQINKFSSQQDNRVNALEPCLWSLLAEVFLDEHSLVENKQVAPLFNGVVYKNIEEIDTQSTDWGIDGLTDESFVKRRKANIKQVELHRS